MDETGMEEHRNSLRRRTFLKGRIEFNKGQSSAECLVRDLSETGARIALAGSVMLPDHFDLYLPHKAQTISCRLSWSRNGEIGVRFDDELEETKPGLQLAPEVAKKMKELEDEVARLRRLIDQLKAEPDKISVLLGNAI